MATFHRIVRSNPPTIVDFLSDRERGKPPPPDPALRYLWDGISVYRTEAQARNKARRFPALGMFLARLEIPEGELVEIERTLSSRGHHTLWGEPAYFLSRVVRVLSV